MQHRVRAMWILVLLASGYTIISFNLIQIQLVQHDKFWRMAVENHTHPEAIPPRRGTVYDVDGNILAQTQRLYDIRLDGQGLKHPDAELPRIAEVLGVSAQSLREVFTVKNRYLLIAHDVEDSTVAKLQALKLDAVIAEPHDRRIYPNNELAAHVLGYVDENGHGVAGMEKEEDKLLAGVPGERLVERDGRKHTIALYASHEKPAINGCNVTLTLRMSIQHIVEDQLDQVAQTYKPNAAYIIVMDPHTGEILGMGSRPNYDPNIRTEFTPDRIRDRCITDGVEPGSIFKIITLAGALNEGMVNLNTQIFCENGAFTYAGRTLHDDNEHFGWLSVLEVMAKSSNIGFAKIALNCLHEEKLYQYATAFGMGQRTGLFGQQGESAGLLRPVNKWSGLSITRVPMGQEVLATPIQLVTAMCVIANGGKLMQPQLTKQITDEDGRVVETFQPKVVRRVISTDAARDAARALEQVTIDGTAKAVKIQDATGACLSYGGKTGTAQKWIDGEYSKEHHVTSFIGFAPAVDPAFVVLVMVDDPKTELRKDYGAMVSAPVFATVARQVAQIENIPMDIPAPPPVQAANTIDSKTSQARL